jgi:hypothetical protein
LAVGVLCEIWEKEEGVWGEVGGEGGSERSERVREEDFGGTKVGWNQSQGRERGAGSHRELGGRRVEIS